MISRAVIREIPASFADALAAVRPDPPIDVALARAEHAAYRAALEWLGLAITVLPADESCPDCCFVEDAAVVAAGVALVTRPGAPSRRAEVEPVATALAPFAALERMAAPATLDGGDVAKVGLTLYVGRSSRTNQAGIQRLADVFEPRGVHVVAVDMPPGVLHLKSVCSPLDDDRLLVAAGAIGAASFPGASVVLAPAAEAHAANAVAVGRRVVVADGAPRTRELLHALGFETRAVPTSQANKVDGALTCQSILF